jgi:hypothetical protein
MVRATDSVLATGTRSFAIAWRLQTVGCVLRTIAKCGPPTAQIVPHITAVKVNTHPAPVGWIHALLHISMERRVRPIGDRRNVTMLHRVPVNVSHVPSVIGLISNKMLPEAPLPEICFLTLLSRLAQRCISTLAATLADMSLDDCPSRRKIVVFRRRCPQAVQVVGE